MSKRYWKLRKKPSWRRSANSKLSTKSVSKATTTTGNRRSSVRSLASSKRTRLSTMLVLGESSRSRPCTSSSASTCPKSSCRAASWDRCSTWPKTRTGDMVSKISWTSHSRISCTTRSCMTLKSTICRRTSSTMSSMPSSKRFVTRKRPSSNIWQTSLLSGSRVAPSRVSTAESCTLFSTRNSQCP